MPPGKCEMLHQAIRQNNATGVRALLSARCPLNAIDEHGDTPLLTAIRCFRNPILQLLIEHGADVNARSHRPSRITPLMSAIEEGNFYAYNLLVQHDADFLCMDTLRRTPLLVAVAKIAPHGFFDSNIKDSMFLRQEIFDDVLDRSIEHDVNHAMNDGATPLSIAVTHGHIELVRLLLQRGAAVTSPIREIARTRSTSTTACATMLRLLRAPAAGV